MIRSWEFVRKWVAMAIYPPPIIIHTGNTWIWVKPILMKTITIIVCFGSLLDKYLVYLTTNFIGSASENGACFFLLKLEYNIQTHFRKIYSVNSLHSITIESTQCALQMLRWPSHLNHVRKRSFAFGVMASVSEPINATQVKLNDRHEMTVLLK